MAESGQLPEPLRQVVDANLEYYRALGRVTAEYFKAVGRIWSEAATGLVRGAGPLWTTAPQPGRPASSASPASAGTGASGTAPAQPALVLEAEAGSSAEAVFMVENGLSRTVSASVMTSDFAGDDGRRLQPALRVQPGTVTLQPGARTLVRLTALVDAGMVPGVSYRGEVSVPGLSDTPIPVVLRRRADAVGKPATSRATGAGKPVPTASAAGEAPASSPVAAPAARRRARSTRKPAARPEG